MISHNPVCSMCGRTVWGQPYVVCVSGKAVKRTVSNVCYCLILWFAIFDIVEFVPSYCGRFDFVSFAV